MFILSFHLKQLQLEGMYNKYFKSPDEHEIMDIYEMFNYYNTFFFEGKLEKCYVEWSEKMTLCAGTCTHSSYDSCTIKLSAPLLQYRTANELKETLLHEMIHAFLFLTNPRACLTEGGHGKEFQEVMRNINNITSLNITIYHNFHDEVNLHRKHVWRCNGLCKTQPPFYGYVKRAMNRKPQTADRWFAQHKRVCGGQFIKESGPEEKPKQSKKNNNSKQKNGKGKKEEKGKTIDEYFKQMKRQDKAKQKKRQAEIPQSQKQPQTFTTVIKVKTIAEYCAEMQQQKSRL